MPTVSLSLSKPCPSSLRFQRKDSPSTSSGKRRPKKDHHLNAQRDRQIEPADQDLPRLRASLYVAQEMGARLG